MFRERQCYRLFKIVDNYECFGESVDRKDDGCIGMSNLVDWSV